MTLDQWSNLFVYASMAMYAAAFVAFAVSFGASRSPEPKSRGDQPVLAGVAADRHGGGSHSQVEPHAGSHCARGGGDARGRGRASTCAGAGEVTPDRGRAGSGGARPRSAFTATLAGR